MTSTPIKDIPQIVQVTQDATKRQVLSPLKARKELLSRLYDLVDRLRSEFHAALWTDLHKSPTSSDMTELSLVLSEIAVALEKVDEWARPRYLESMPLAQIMDTASVEPQPLGTVLIISPWNYPVLLLLQPLIGAIAAGNCVVLKPSELSPNVAQVIAKLVKKLESPAVSIVLGAAAETQALLECKFDQITYTGNGHVARIVMAAAAKHLTPVLLELGGKSPVIIDKKFDLKLAAKRIMWAKTLNAGQTCVAPDYVFCHKSLVDKFVQQLKVAQKELYGEDVASHEEYARIINHRHFTRIKNLMDKQVAAGATVALGGQTNEKEKFIAPTVFTGVGLDASKHPLMSEELFGPVLPIIAYENVKETLDHINSGEKPLALYVFSDDTSFIDRIKSQTSSGAVVVNDLLMHVSMHDLPFGGVGESGMGYYHGKYSFDAYSHLRSVLVRPAGAEAMNEVRYPPFPSIKKKLIRFFIEKKKPGAMVLVLSKVSRTIRLKILLYLMVVVAAFIIGRYAGRA